MSLLCGASLADSIVPALETERADPPPPSSSERGWTHVSACWTILLGLVWGVSDAPYDVETTVLQQHPIPGRVTCWASLWVILQNPLASHSCESPMFFQQVSFLRQAESISVPYKNKL